MTNIIPLHPRQTPAHKRRIAITAALRNARHILLNTDLFTPPVQHDARRVLAHFGTPSEQALIARETGATITYPQTPHTTEAAQ